MARIQYNRSAPNDLILTAKGGSNGPHHPLINAIANPIPTAALEINGRAAPKPKGYADLNHVVRSGSDDMCSSTNPAAARLRPAAKHRGRTANTARHRSKLELKAATCGPQHGDSIR
jgi:hypothetical protein